MSPACLELAKADLKWPGAAAQQPPASDAMTNLQRSRAAYNVMSLLGSAAAGFGHDLNMFLWQDSKEEFLWGCSLTGGMPQHEAVEDNMGPFKAAWDALSNGNAAFDAGLSTEKPDVIEDLRRIYVESGAKSRRGFPPPESAKSWFKVVKWIRECSEEEGIDHMVDAYFNGVPVGDIIA